MAAVYGFRSGPSYRGVSQPEMMTAALDQPLGFFDNLGSQVVGGALSSPGLGTAIRDIATPEGTGDGPTSILDIGPFPSPLKSAVQYFINDNKEPLSQDAYKTSSFFREDIPWDAGMTEDRAASLASWYDAKQVREHFASKRPISSFIAGMAGQAFDPVNYIPVAGPAVKAAAVARVGRIGGAALAGSIDAAANTAIAGLATASTRSRFGDDVSWQAQITDIATAAFIGGAFGTVGGFFEGRAADKSALKLAQAESQLATLKTQQHARIALNEAIGAVSRGEDIALSPNALEPMQRVAQEKQNIAQAWDEVRQNPTGPVRDPLIEITPEDIEGTIIARGAFKDINEVEFSKAGWGLVKVIWRHGPESKTEKPELQVQKDDLTALPDVIRRYEPVATANGKGRNWVVDRNGRTVVYADRLFEGDTKRHVVTAYVQATKDPSKALPLSRERPAAVGSSSEVSSPIQDTAQDAFSSRGEGQPLPASGTIGSARSVDNSLPRTEALPEGRAQAETAVGAGDDAKAIAAHYRIDPETGAYDEEVDIAQIRIEGRLTESDEAALADAEETYQNGSAFGDALRAAVGCLI
jgi:hypothetical protein